MHGEAGRAIVQATKGQARLRIDSKEEEEEEEEEEESHMAMQGGKPAVER